MKSALFYTFFLVLSNSIYGQVSNVMFVGAATINGGGVYTYRLLVNDSNGIVTGYSVTDINGANETKTTVHGTVNTDKKTLKFKETKIIYTKSKSAKEDFCYINTSLKIANIKGATALKGNFTGYKEDGKTTCASGKLMLVAAQDVLDKLLEIAAKNSADNEDEHPAPQPNIVYEHAKEVPDNAVTKINPTNTATFLCSSPEVIIDVWDAKNVDGDVITLMQDGNIILKDYTITGTHKQLTLKMGDRKTSTLTLIAVSEGSEPPNTARLKITSGTDQYYADATTTIGKNVTVVLKRK